MCCDCVLTVGREVAAKTDACFFVAPRNFACSDPPETALVLDSFRSNIASGGDIPIASAACEMCCSFGREFGLRERCPILGAAEPRSLTSLSFRQEHLYITYPTLPGPAFEDAPRLRSVSDMYDTDDKPARNQERDEGTSQSDRSHPKELGAYLSPAGCITIASQRAAPAGEKLVQSAYRPAGRDTSTDAVVGCCV